MRETGKESCGREHRYHNNSFLHPQKILFTRIDKKMSLLSKQSARICRKQRDGDCPVRYVIPAATQPTFASKKENSKYTNHADCEQQYMDAFFLTKFNLKTPGREDDDADETKVTLSNNNFTEVAKIVLEGVGGPENVASIDNCITRLRLEVKDYTKVNEKLIKSAGVAGVMRPSKTSVQVIIGTQVQFVADEFKKLCK